MLDKIFLKLILTTLISFVVSIVFISTTKLDPIQSITIYFSAYFASLVLTFISKRFSYSKITKNKKFTFLFILSIIEIFLFFIIECSIISNENTTIQNIFNLNRILFLLLRYLCVNKLILFDLKKLGFIFIIYAGNICGYFFRQLENLTIENFVVTLTGLILIMIILSIIQKPENETMSIDFLKHLFECFFLIKQGRSNNLIYIKGDILSLGSTRQAKFHQEFIKLKGSYLNKLFLVEKSSLACFDCYKKVQSSNEKYVEIDLDEFIFKTLSKRDGKETRIKAKIKGILSKNFILAIKSIMLGQNKYMLIEVQELKSNKIHEAMEESEKQQFLTKNLANIKGILVKSHISVKKIMNFEHLDEKNTDKMKLIMSQFKLNIAKIDNMMLLHEFNNNQLPLKLTKAKFNIFLNEILAFLIPIAKLKKIEFDFAIDDFLTDKTIKLDYGKLELILSNLLINSVKSAILNSTISISITFNEDLKTIKFLIQDSGVKMDTINQDELNLKMINKQDSSDINLTKIFPNLFLTQKLLSLFGQQNTLNITSRVGKGNSYEFSLPPTKIYEDKSKNPQNFSLIDVSKKDPSTASQKIQRSTTNKAAFSISEFKSLSTSTKTEISGQLLSSKKTAQVRNYNLKCTRLDSWKRLRHDYGSNIEKAGCSCHQVLVINDNFVNLTICRMVFANLKLKSFMTENETKAIEKLILQNNCTDPDCEGFLIIIIDCSPPTSSRLSLIKKIKNLMSQQVINTIPILGNIIFVSKNEVSEFINAGLSDFIPNPLNKNTLVESIKKWTKLKDK